MPRQLQSGGERSFLLAVSRSLVTTWARRASWAPHPGLRRRVVLQEMVVAVVVVGSVGAVFCGIGAGVTSLVLRIVLFLRWRQRVRRCYLRRPCTGYSVAVCGATLLGLVGVGYRLMFGLLVVVVHGR